MLLPLPARGLLLQPWRAATTARRRPMATAAGDADAAGVAAALSAVRSRLETAAERAGRGDRMPRLVAVSKTKPAAAVAAAYAAGQRHFGENYVQELVGKAGEVAEVGDGVRWHYIGALQSNKAKALMKVKGLWCVESVDREKTAAALEKAAAAAGRGLAAEDGAVAAEQLRVMVQVNTSGEESKAGCAPGEAVGLARYVVEECASLQLVGLMTIGAPDDAERPAAFSALAECRGDVERELGLEGLELSMGMSGDFERAVAMGSDSVRVGSTIFGARDYGPK